MARRVLGLLVVAAVVMANIVEEVTQRIQLGRAQIAVDDYVQKYPEYEWANNKGYPTKKHRDAIREYGPTPFHRMSFQLLPRQLKLDLEK